MSTSEPMQTVKVVLCAEEECLRHPELIGLPGEQLEGRPWLMAVSSAEQVRGYLRAVSTVEEAWISSSDEVSALNLAAALHQDRSDLAIRLVLFSASGSVRSNAAAAGVSEVLDEVTFPKRFAETCLAMSGMTSGPSMTEPVRQVSEVQRTGSLMACALAGEQAGDAGLLLPVLSGSGGAGRSTVCAVLAHLIQKRGLSVAVLDLDLQFGDMHRLFGIEKPLTVNDILSDPEAVDALRPSSAEGCVEASRPALIAAPERLEQAELVCSHAGEVIALCQSLFDVVVVNTGAAWADHHALLLERSASPLFLIDQRASSVLACKHALELCARMGTATRSVVFALNRCSREAMFTGIDIAMALQGAHVLEIRDGGHEVEELLGSGMADELCAARNEMVRSVDTIIDEAIELPALAPAKRKRGLSHRSAGQEGGALTSRKRHEKVEVIEMLRPTAKRRGSRSCRTHADHALEL